MGRWGLLWKRGGRLQTREAATIAEAYAAASDEIDRGADVVAIGDDLSQSSFVASLVARAERQYQRYAGHPD